jgi:hypothetical protein
MQRNYEQSNAESNCKVQQCSNNLNPELKGKENEIDLNFNKLIQISNPS